MFREWLRAIIDEESIIVACGDRVRFAQPAASRPRGQAACNT